MPGGSSPLGVGHQTPHCSAPLCSAEMFSWCGQLVHVGVWTVYGQGTDEGVGVAGCGVGHGG